MGPSIGAAGRPSRLLRSPMEAFFVARPSERRGAVFGIRTACPMGPKDGVGRISSWARP